jgi:hypothetical protein
MVSMSSLARPRASTSSVRWYAMPKSGKCERIVDERGQRDLRRLNSVPRIRSFIARNVA